MRLAVVAVVTEDLKVSLSGFLENQSDPSVGREEEKIIRRVINCN